MYCWRKFSVSQTISLPWWSAATEASKDAECEGTIVVFAVGCAWTVGWIISGREERPAPLCICAWQWWSNEAAVQLFCSSGDIARIALCNVLKMSISACPTLLFLLPTWHIGVHSARSLSKVMLDNRTPFWCCDVEVIWLAKCSLAHSSASNLATPWSSKCFATFAQLLN